jgi:hypothetical protein
VASHTLVASCIRQSSPLDKAIATAAAPGGGRAAAANELVTAWRAKTITFDEAIDLASARLEAVANLPTPNAAASTEATLFAGAILDALATTRAEFPRNIDLTIFWIKVGRLAFRTAEEAHAAGRLPESATLVEAGPRDWQNEAYWHLYPDHDALAAVIMAQSGQPMEAMRRLESRVELKGPAEEVLAMLKAQQPR